MICNFRFLLLQITCVFIAVNIVSADDIPAILWNIKGNSLPMKPVSAFGNHDLVVSESIKDILHQDGCILVYAVNKLSLEDFSTNEKPAALNNTLNNIENFLNDERQPYIFLASVKNPLNYIHQAHCRVQEIAVDNKIDENVMKSVSKAMETSCVVILHVSDSGIVAKKDEIKSVFLPSLGTKKNYVAMFTGVKSSWGAPDSDHHVFRNLLAVKSDDEHFMNYTGCMIMYSSNITVTVGKENNNTVELPFPPKLEGSSCNSSMLQLTFEPKGPITSVILTFNFQIVGNSWVAKQTLVTISGEKTEELKDIELNSEIIDASVGYSYSCGKLTLNEKNSSHGIKIDLIGFQVQPYQVDEVFSESFDCVPFFTIPIWMGICVGILFIVILEIGIYALFSVHTMDRFDDPKGKTISVATSGD